ncbi:pheA operon leader peptide PheL, partial [Klebsiella pneumoniae]|nr:pheA operon leader peptide PheL [Klebsiella pneumoniae]
MKHTPFFFAFFFT